VQSQRHPWHADFITMPLGGMPNPSLGQLAWQMMTSLAYGAKGLLWFCWLTPARQGPVFNRGGSPLSPTGRNGCVDHNCSNASNPLPPSDVWQKPSPHFRHAGRLNGIVRTYGDFLLDATSVGVYWARPDPLPADPDAVHHMELQPSTNLGDGVSAIAAVKDEGDYGLRISARLAGEGVLLGQFELRDGRTAVLICNHNFDWTLWPTLVAAPGYDLTQATEVKGDGGGAETPLLDDSPLMPGQQLSLSPGMARLIVMERVTGESIDADRVTPRRLLTDDGNDFATKVSTRIYRRQHKSLDGQWGFELHEPAPPNSSTLGPVVKSGNITVPVRKNCTFPLCLLSLSSRMRLCRARGKRRGLGTVRIRCERRC